MNEKPQPIQSIQSEPKPIKKQWRKPKLIELELLYTESPTPNESMDDGVMDSS